MTTFEYSSDHQFLNNSGKEWLTAAVVAAMLFVIFLVARRILRVSFAADAARSRSEIDQAIADLIRQTRPLFLLAVALDLGSRSLVIKETAVIEHVQQLFEIIILFQCALWGIGLATFFTERALTRRGDDTDRIGIAAIRTLGVGAKLIVWAVVATTAIKVVDSKFDLSAMLTAGAVGGLAIALAVQNILGDLLATLAIVFDRPFDVGDTIAVDQVSGTVEQIGLKTTRVRSVTGEQVILANGDLLKSRLRNYKRMEERRVTLTLDLAYDTPRDLLERVPAMLTEIINAEPTVRFDRSHLAAVTDAGFRTETVYYVLDRDYTKYMDAQHAITLKTLRRFDAEGIRIAFPTRVPDYAIPSKSPSRGAASGPPGAS